MSPKYLDFLYNLGMFNIKLGLETIEKMLEKLDNPHLHPKIIHLAGTNGKGSTLAVIERLLLDSGFSVGSTISPHLISFNERFRLNGKPVIDKDLDWAFFRVCKAIKIKPDLQSPTSEDGEISPTFFEFSLAMAFELFRKYDVDYILLETGLGGRLDATNIIINPLACVLTRIAVDHQEFLGDTIVEITQEKLGILKVDAPVFVAHQEEAVSHLIKDRCAQLSVPCYLAGDHFDYQADDFQTSSAMYCLQKSMNGSFEEKHQPLEIHITQPGLIGDHQKENMATALAVYLSVVPNDQWLSNDRINRTLQNVKWPGRLEYIHQGKILLDGAHNASGMATLLDHLKSCHESDRIIMAIAWKKEKHLLDGLNKDDLSNIIFLPLQMVSKASENIENITQLLSKKELEVLTPIDVPTLVEKIKKKTLPNHDLLVIAGSLYLLGEFLGIWNKN